MSGFAARFVMGVAPLLLVGCNGFADLVESKAAAAARVAAEVTMPEHRRRARKLDGYLHCVNFTSAAARQSVDHYHAWADPAQGPAGDIEPTPRRRVLSLPDDPTCREGIERSNEMEPRDLELELAAAEYLAAYGTAQTITERARAWYDSDDVAVDPGIARDLHPELETAFARLAVADAIFRTTLEHRNGIRLQDDLDALERSEGRSARFHRERILVRARALSLTATAGAPDEQELRRSFDALDESLAEAGALGQPDAQLLAVVEAATKVRAAARQLIERRQDGEPFTVAERKHLDYGTPSLVDGTPARVAEAYRNLQRIAR